MHYVAADNSEAFFEKSSIVRPHPYIDSRPVGFENNDELLNAVHTSRKMKSLDAHGIFNFIF